MAGRNHQGRLAVLMIGVLACWGLSCIHSLDELPRRDGGAAVEGEGEGLTVEGEGEGLTVEGEGEGVADCRPGPLNPDADPVEAGWSLICPSTFQLGSPPEEAGRNIYAGQTDYEIRHAVTVTRPFLIQATEVTREQWEALVPEVRTPWFVKCGGSCPAVALSWYEAVVYCNRLTERENGPRTILTPCYTGVTGEAYQLTDIPTEPAWDPSCTGYRLPTEAEWELAARAGTTTPFFATPRQDQDTACDNQDLDELGWYCGNSAVEYPTERFCAGAPCGIQPVGQRQANPWGLFDVHGNVWEWCWDWWVPYPDLAPEVAVVDPRGPADPPADEWVGGTQTAPARVHRSGAYDDDSARSRAASRMGQLPAANNHNIGFRPVRTIVPEPATDCWQFCRGAAPLADRQSGVCEGLRQICDLATCTWREPRPEELRGRLAHYELEELTADCLDNDCDGATDEVGPEPDPEERWPPVCPGTFIMGSPGPECDGGCTCGPAQCRDPRCAEACPGAEPERKADEPQHAVTLTWPFVMQATEVTQAQWAVRCFGDDPCRPFVNPSYHQGGANAGQRPVETISWFEALAYCNALSSEQSLPPCYHLAGCRGRPGAGLECQIAQARYDPPQSCPGYRLPTEAEWEYAARAGTATLTYWSDELDEAPWRGNNPAEPLPVATWLPNGWGLYDLHGNVFEWCWDQFDGAYATDPVTDPCGAVDGWGTRVLRSGSAGRSIAEARSAFRFALGVDQRGREGVLGLRPVRTVGVDPAQECWDDVSECGSARPPLVDPLPGVCAGLKQVCRLASCRWEDPRSLEGELLIQGYLPDEEQCDGLDNDCDGRTDEEAETAGYKGRALDVEVPYAARWVRICAGTYLIGSPGTECAAPCTCGAGNQQCQDPRCSAESCPGAELLRADGDREAQHPVTFTRSFAIQATEVTQAQWLALRWQEQPVTNPSTFQVGGAGGCEGEPCDDRPVDNVTWYEALAYCNWRSGAEGYEPCYILDGCTGEPGEGMTCATAEARYDPPQSCPGYRLPTEAEWEVAARAGCATAYSGTADTDLEPLCFEDGQLLEDLAWYEEHSSGRTHRVAQLRPNRWGLYDLHGNVWEWCWDGYDGGAYPGTTDDPVGDGPGRVLRGGSWGQAAREARAAQRRWSEPGHPSVAQREGRIGFRPVRTLQP